MQIPKPIRDRIQFKLRKDWVEEIASIEPISRFCEQCGQTVANRGHTIIQKTQSGWVYTCRECKSVTKKTEYDK